MTRLKKSLRVTVNNPHTGEREIVDLVRDLGMEIPSDSPFTPDTFHAVAWLDQYALDAWFKRQK